jgi:hypothetical protein
VAPAKASREVRASVVICDIRWCDPAWQGCQQMRMIRESINFSAL